MYGYFVSLGTGYGAGENEDWQATWGGWRMPDNYHIEYAYKHYSDNGWLAGHWLGPAISEGAPEAGPGTQGPIYVGPPTGLYEIPRQTFPRPVMNGARPVWPENHVAPVVFVPPAPAAPSAPPGPSGSGFLSPPGAMAPAAGPLGLSPSLPNPLGFLSPPPAPPRPAILNDPFGMAWPTAPPGLQTPANNGGNNGLQPNVVSPVPGFVSAPSGVVHPGASFAGVPSRIVDPGNRFGPAPNVGVSPIPGFQPVGLGPQSFAIPGTAPGSGSSSSNGSPLYGLLAIGDGQNDGAVAPGNPQARRSVSPAANGLVLFSDNQYPSGPLDQANAQAAGDPSQPGQPPSQAGSSPNQADPSLGDSYIFDSPHYQAFLESLLDGRAPAPDAFVDPQLVQAALSPRLPIIASPPGHNQVASLPLPLWTPTPLPQALGPPPNNADELIAQNPGVFQPHTQRIRDLWTLPVVNGNVNFGNAAMSRDNVNQIRTLLSPTPIRITSEPVERPLSPGSLVPMFARRDEALPPNHPAAATHGVSPLAAIPTNRIFIRGAIVPIAGLCVHCQDYTHGICESTDHSHKERCFVCSQCNETMIQNLWNLMVSFDLFSSGYEVFDLLNLEGQAPQYDPRVRTQNHYPGEGNVVRGAVHSVRGHSGCACAEKLLDRRLCGTHRAQGFFDTHNRIHQMAAYVWNKFNVGDICFACLQNSQQRPDDPTADGAEAGRAWQCMNCSALVLGVSPEVLASSSIGLYQQMPNHPEGRTRPLLIEPAIGSNSAPNDQSTGTTGVQDPVLVIQLTQLRKLMSGRIFMIDAKHLELRANNMNNPTTLMKRLEAVAARLEDVAETIESSKNAVPAADASPAPPKPSGLASDPVRDARLPPSTGDSPEPLPKSVEAFDIFLEESVGRYVRLSNELGGAVARQAVGVLAGFKEQRRILLIASKTAKPDASGWQNLTRQMSYVAAAVVAIQEASRGDSLHRHLSCVADGIPMLSWIEVELRAFKRVDKFLGHAQYFGNKLLTQYKEK
ncbi:putative Zn(2)-C6 fungal-type domain-containing protein [Seiridium cardinale]